jgi:flagellar brake protein
MFADTQPVPFDGPAGPAAHGEFRVTDRAEIAGLLRSLMDGNVPLHLSTPEGAAHSATLWTTDVHAGKIAFTANVLDPGVHRIVESDEAVAVGYLDRIKVQFDVSQVMLVHGRNHCVLQAAWPRTVYRFQRRGAFRVRTLDRTSPTAIVRHPSMPDMTLSLRVLDVSAGGMALFQPHDMPALEPGIEMAGARIELDADTQFVATVMIRHVTSIQPNARGVRLGCELRGLDGAAQRALQRYIDQTQKRRRTMAL